MVSKTHHNKKDIENYSVSDIQLLKDISEMILFKSNMADTMEKILDLINEKVKSLFLIYLIVDENTNELKLGSYTNEKIKFVNHLLYFDIFQIKYPISISGPLITTCIKENRITQSNSLKDFFYPVFPHPFVLDQIQKILRIKLGLGVPIRLSNKVTGVIFVASQEETISLTQINTIQLYANLAGIAISNHLQFQKLENAYESEKETTSVLSHELKTPIAMAYNSSQLLNISLKEQSKSIDPEIYLKLQKKAEEIHENINRMSRICNSIFSLREVENKIPEDLLEIDLEKQLDQTLSNFQYKANQKNLTFNYYLPQQQKKLFGAIIQFEQILIILIDNALKYTEKGSVEVQIDLNEQTLKASVTDTGPGIPPKEKEKIFQRFYRQKTWFKKRTEGLGIGLYIAQKIINKVNGKITVGNNPNQKGSQFIIEIPLHSNKNTT